jgi:hypothetical protein
MQNQSWATFESRLPRRDYFLFRFPALTQSETAPSEKLLSMIRMVGASGIVVFEALCYEPEGRGIASR